MVRTFNSWRFCCSSIFGFAVGTSVSVCRTYLPAAHTEEYADVEFVIDRVSG